MELKSFLTLLRSRVRQIAALTIIGLLAGATYTALEKPSYKATAKDFVSIAGANSISDLTLGSTYTQQLVGSCVDLATTPYVLDPVKSALDLNLSDDLVARQLDVVNPENTVFINITASAESGSAAAALANAVALRLTEAVPAITNGNDRTASSVRVTTVQQAFVPSSPAQPSLVLDLMIGGFAGLVAGVVLALISERLNSRFRTADELARYSALPILGSLRYDPIVGQSAMIAPLSSQTEYAESVRVLRTNLQYLRGSASRVLLFTSSGPNEGKSTSIAYLALVVAESGKRVLVIDADLRRPTLGTYFSLDTAIGLSDVLRGSVPVEKARQSWGERQIDILPAGPTPPNPSELLGSNTMKELLSQAEREYDLILVDSPPVSAVTDAAILGALSGSAIVVVAARQTTGAHLDSAVGALTAVGIRVLGLVLTKTRSGQRSGYGSYSAFVSRPKAARPTIHD